MAYPVSEQFQAVLLSQQVIYIVTATVTSGGVPLVGFMNLPVEAATVTCSRTQAQRTTLTVQFDPLAVPNIVPTGMSSPVAPNGNEIVLSAGIKYIDGTTEMVPCGVFPIETVVVTDTGTDLSMQVTCADRSWSVSRRVLLQPYTIATGITLDQALYDLLSSNTTGMPSFNYAIETSDSDAPPNTYNEGQDPWQAALDIAAGAGFECFFDRYGNVQARPIPAPGSIATTWSLSAVQAGPLSITRTITANQVANDYVVYSSSGNVVPPARGEADDSNPSSPTYVDGKFGDIVVFLSSQTITTAVAAQAAAQAQLNASLGQIDSLSVSCVPNPAVDIDDVYTITRTRAGLNGESWVVDGYTLPFQIGAAMTLTLRKVIL